MAHPHNTTVEMIDVNPRAPAMVLFNGDRSEELQCSDATAQLESDIVALVKKLNLK